MAEFPGTSVSNQPPPPTLANPRFTLELEFVLSLANPYYLQHLAVNYPNLLGTSAAGEHHDDSNDDNGNASPDSQAFAAYLAYLYSYWKTPEYAQFLTYPGATLQALRLLQEEAFRRDIIRPQVIEGLLGVAETQKDPAQREVVQLAAEQASTEQQVDVRNGTTA
jgi:mediator of RNA polymerase II transcription subunit 31